MARLREDFESLPEQDVLTGPPFRTVIKNDAPLWVEFCAMTFPCEGWVNPAAGFLAPRGGADNLCNDNERYTDYCQFEVEDTASDVEFLVIGTEESSWKFRLEPPSR